MDDSLSSQVHEAARANDLVALGAILKQQPDSVDIENDDGEAPLVSAAVAGSSDAVSLLLSHGADPSRQKGFALTCACYWGHAGTVQVLLNGGADRVIREVRRWHGLHAACGWGDESRPNADIVKQLLDAGANAKRVFEGHTPTQYAQASGQPEIVSILKQHIRSQ